MPACFFASLETNLFEKLGKKMGLFNWFKGKKKGQDEEEKIEDGFTEEKAESGSSDGEAEEFETLKYEEQESVEILTENTTENNEISIDGNQLQKDVLSDEAQAERERKNVINEVQMEKQIKDCIDDEIKNENDMQSVSDARENTSENREIYEDTEVDQTQNIANDVEVQNAAEPGKEENQESEEIQEQLKEKKMGFFKRLVSGLTKTRNNIVSGIDSILKGFSSIDDDFYEELEEILIMGDLGVNTTLAIIEDLKEKVKEQKIKEPTACKELLIESIKKQMAVGETDYEFENRKSVILLIGVNGVGKTTTIGKLSGQFKQQGKKVMVAAADTFRAAAIDQLAEWAKRANVDIIAQQEGSDPAAVVYDAVAAAKARNTDILLCDTAGRLHNKKNLMEELRKINKVIDREYPDAYKETLVVLDGTTGQNALAQAKQFNEVAEITGIVLTKLDGTAKGGIAIAIQSELGIPVKYIGIGEKIEDLQKFNSEEFVNALFDMSE